MSVRIVGGRFAGRELLGPPSRRRRPGAVARRMGGETRPAAARLRKSLFAVLADEIPGARVLDVCAGVGALGFEALSRGAAHCVFVERSRGVAERLGRSALRLGLAGADLRVGPAERLLPALRRRGERFDLVFLDPPWNDWSGKEGDRRPAPALGLLAAAAALRPGLLVAVHRASSSLPAEGRPGLGPGLGPGNGPGRGLGNGPGLGAATAAGSEAAPESAPEAAYRRVRTTAAGDGAFSLYRLSGPEVAAARSSAAAVAEPENPESGKARPRTDRAETALTTLS